MLLVALHGHLEAADLAKEWATLQEACRVIFVASAGILRVCPFSFEKIWNLTVGK